MACRDGCQRDHQLRFPALFHNSCLCRLILVALFSSFLLSL